MKLPDCMMPDGAEPCCGAKDMTAEIERLTRELAAAKTLLHQAANHIYRWNEKYGEHNPQWLPPSGSVDLIERIDANLRGEK